MTDRLEDLAKQLGARAADRVDVERTARAVVERLREQPIERRWWQDVRVLRLAAGVVLILGAGLFARSRLGGGPGAAMDSTLVQPVADEQSLDSAQLAVVLHGLDQPVAAVAGSADAGLEDLSEPQLQALLRSMED